MLSQQVDHLAVNLTGLRLRGHRLPPPALFRFEDEFGQLCPQSGRESLRYVQARISQAAFDQADICGMDASSLGKFLLRQLCGPTARAHHISESLCVHSRKCDAV
jgi:hypothetical protein